MARIRLNNEYRNKVANRIKVHLQQEDTQEKRKYDKLKADQVDSNDMAWSVAEKIVRRHYTESDVEKAYYLQNKFEMFRLLQKIVVSIFIISEQKKREVMTMKLEPKKMFQ